MKLIYRRAFDRISQKLTPSYLSDLQHHGASLYHLFPRDDLRCLLKIPCKLIKTPAEEMKTIEVGKRLRASVQASEAKICQQCPAKENCKVSFLPGEEAGKEAIDDIMHFLGRLGEEEIEEKPRVYVAGFKILMALPEIVEILKSDSELVEKFDVERLKLSEERVKKDEEMKGSGVEAGKKEGGKVEYRRERVEDSEQIRSLREERRSANKSRQLFEEDTNEVEEGGYQGRRNEREGRGDRGERRDRGDREDNKFQRRNKYEGRDNNRFGDRENNRYGDRENNKFEKRSRSDGDWNNQRGQNRGQNRRYQRDNQVDQFGKRDFQRNQWNNNDRGNNYRERNDRGDRNDRNERGFGDRNDRFEKKQFNYQRDNQYQPREQREQGGYQPRQRDDRFRNQDRPQKRYEERAPRRSLDNLYENADFTNKKFESGFDQTQGSVNRRPIPNEGDLSKFDEMFGGASTEKEGRQGRRGMRGGRASRQE